MKAAFVAIFSWACLCFVAQAQVIVAYDTPTGNEFAATTLAAGVTATALNATGSSVNVFSGGFQPDSVSVGVTAGSISPATAVANAQFFQFTVSPPSGSKINLTALLFQEGRGGATAPRGWVVRSSQDGFAADLASGEVTTESPVYTSFSTFLPKATFTGIAAPITFRIFSFAPAAGNRLDYRTIQLVGIVDAPPILSVASAKKISTTKSRVALTGVAFDDVGISSVTANGKSISNGTTFRTTVRLTKRVTTVTFRATDTGGLTSAPVKIKIVRTTL